MYYIRTVVCFQDESAIYSYDFFVDKFFVFIYIFIYRMHPGSLLKLAEREHECYVPTRRPEPGNTGGGRSKAKNDPLFYSTEKQRVLFFFCYLYIFYEEIYV